MQDLVEKVKGQYRDGAGLTDTNVSNRVQLLMRVVLRKLENKESGGVWISTKEMETHQMDDVYLKFW